MKQILWLVAGLTVVVSCTRDSRSSKSEEIMHDYFATMDSFPYHDTLRYDFELLKAYYNRDTAHLRESYQELVKSLRTWDHYDPKSACESPRPLYSLPYEEAYRFDYEAAFCDSLIAITIGKRGAKVFATTLFLKEDYQTRHCITLKQVDQELDMKVWERLDKGIRYADFWGMRPESEEDEGLDGSFLDVFGYDDSKSVYLKGGYAPARYKAIYRWAAEPTAIGHVFKDLLDDLNIKVACFHFRFYEYSCDGVERKL